MVGKLIPEYIYFKYFPRTHRTTNHMFGTCLPASHKISRNMHTYLHMGYARGILIGSMVQHNIYRGAMASRTLVALLAMVERRVLPTCSPCPSLLLALSSLSSTDI